MSTLYIRLPARAAFGPAVHTAAAGCAYALAADDGSVLRDGVAPLPELAPLMVQAARVQLILSAADVTLLRVVVPPMSAARLRLALPNLVEDQLIADVADCVLAAGRSVDGLRTIAVAQRDWLQTMAMSLAALGARKVTAVPAQLCLPLPAQGASAALVALPGVDGVDTVLVVRLASEQGVGVPVLPQAAQPLPVAALHTAQVVAAGAALTLYVPATEVDAYQQALAAIDAAQAESAVPERSTVTIQPDRWAFWIAGAGSAQPDLLYGLGAEEAVLFDWHRWRWPLRLAAAVLLVNLLALNLDWWHLRQEAVLARSTLTKVFQDAYPQQTVIVDPVLQMRQQIASAKRQGGQAAADDFLPLAAHFADAWNGLGAAAAATGTATAAPAIAALEYREHALVVRFKAGAAPPLAPLQTALAARELTVSEQGTDALQIRGAR